MKTKRIFACLYFLLGAVALFAAGKPEVVVSWPDVNPTIRLAFGTFREVGNYAGQTSFVSDVVVENLSSRAIPQASFTVYLFDKSRVRIGEGIIRINNLRSRERTKVAFQFQSVGSPSSLTLAALRNASGDPNALKTVPMRIITIPPGANLSVDGENVGTAPKVINLLMGPHNLEFSKEGFATGSTPLNVSPDDLPGGAITIELGGLSADTVELRDGEVVLGDVISVSVDAVVVRSSGKDHSYNRNDIKKIIFVERQTLPFESSPLPSTPSGRQNSE